MITFKNVKPFPLIENGISPTSDIFNTQVEFEKGKKYLVIAPSGKGKSTMLHLMYGLRSDYEGDILLDNKNIKTFTHDDWATIRQKKKRDCLSRFKTFLTFDGKGKYFY